jgi:hypothetical protein
MSEKTADDAFADNFIEWIESLITAVCGIEVKNLLSRI